MAREVRSEQQPCDGVAGSAEAQEAGHPDGGNARHAAPNVGADSASQALHRRLSFATAMLQKQLDCPPTLPQVSQTLSLSPRTQGLSTTRHQMFISGIFSASAETTCVRQWWCSQ
jgi:hypothetical protein